MRLSLSSISDVIAHYLDEELLPKGTPIQKWMTTFMGVAVAKRAQTIVQNYADTLRMIGILDDEGIDLEEARDLALEAFGKSGPVEVSGIVFSKDDVPTLYNIAKKFSKE